MTDKRWIYILFSGFLSAGICRAGAVLPDEVQRLIESIRQQREQFLQETLEQRLCFRCLDRFAAEAVRQPLLERSRQANRQITETLNELKALRREIENYEGTDWEALYGGSGLWSRMEQTLLQASVYLLETEYWIALSESAEERTKRLGQILHKTDEMNQRIAGLGDLYWISARLQLDGTMTQEVQRRLTELVQCGQCPPEIIDRAYLLLMKYRPDVPLNISERILEQKLSKHEDFEWCTEYAFVQLKAQRSTALKRVLQQWPQASGILEILAFYTCRDLLADPSRLSENRSSALAAQLAGRFVLRSDQPELYRGVIEKLTQQHPVSDVLAAAGRAFASEDPQRAAEYYLQAAKATETPEDAIVYARRAAVIGSRAYQQNPERLRAIALEAMLAYLQQAGDQAEPAMQYSAAGILRDAEMTAESRRLLERLSAGQSPYAFYARLDLLWSEADSITRRQAETKWRTLLKDVHQNAELPKELQVGVLTGYVQFLLKDADAQSAADALQALDEYALLKDPGLILLRAQALTVLDEWGQAVSILSQHPPACEQASFVLSVLQGCLNKIEQYPPQDPSVAEKARQLSRQTESCFGVSEHQRLRWISAEYTLLDANPSKDEMESIRSFIDKAERDLSLEQIRCRARLGMRLNQWQSALADWQQVRLAHEPTDKTRPERSWHWWRARYYELLCYSKLPSADPDQFQRIISILLDSHPDVAKPWAERIDSLIK